MQQDNVNLELMSMVETTILPRYNEFGASHGIAHAQNVIATSIKLAKQLGADIDMAYAIAAYHDLGLEGPRAIHHITSGKILMNDQRLRKWFSPDQIKIMKEAVEDHRASASHQPRSIYGRIVAEADRELDVETVFTRTVQFTLEHFPGLSHEEQWQRFRQHMQEKYSESGYIHLWIPNSPNEKKIKTLRAIIADEVELRKHFEKISSLLFLCDHREK